MSQNEEDERIIPIKNYVILGLIFIIIVALVLYFCNLYHVYDNHQREIPVIRDTLFEIQPDELDHYIMENPTTIIYMCTASNENCRDYERELKKLVVKENLQDEIIYLNLSNIDQNSFVDKFNAKYPYRLKLTKNYPAFVAFENGEIYDILQENEDRKLTITETSHFIETNQTIEEEVE